MTAPLQHRSYIADINPFALPVPPIWWLNGIAAFDADLVVLPSRQRSVHWLARRRTLSAAYAPKLALDLMTDSARCRAHGLIDVTWFASTEGFTEGLLLYLCNELAARDTWAINGRPMTEDDLKVALLNGGSTKYTRLRDEQDAADKKKIDRAVRDDVYHATGEAWRLKQYLTGEMSRPSEDRTPAPASSPLTPDVTPAGTPDTAPDTQAFTGEV